jgi:hypothetical protein
MMERAFKMNARQVNPFVAYAGLLVLTLACSSDPTAGLGRGSVKFTTWGEEYIEEGIPADPEGESGFVDGWDLQYDKFLVNFHAIEVADASGEIGAKSEDSYFVDNTKPGRKALVTFPELAAKAWEAVSYQIKPAKANATVISGARDDLEMMIEQGYSIYVSGTATKGAVTKTFRWGFTTATQYEGCHHEQDGKDTLGIVVTNGKTDTSELTTHGDHFFYDRLQESPDPALKTSLRFDEKAAADEAETGNADGEVTLQEMSELAIDISKYNPSGLHAPTIGAFVTSLARTVGHFRGEGECTISEL